MSADEGISFEARTPTFTRIVSVNTLNLLFFVEKPTLTIILVPYDNPI